MTNDKDTKIRVRLEKQKSRQLKADRTKMKADRTKMKAGDEILKTMLNASPKTHEEMKDK